MDALAEVHLAHTILIREARDLRQCGGTAKEAGAVWYSILQVS